MQKLVYKHISSKLSYLSFSTNTYGTIHLVCQKGGDWTAFSGTIEHFWKFLIDHKGLLLSFFLILINSNLIWKFNGVCAKNVKTGYQGDLRKTRHVKQQIKYTQLYDDKWQQKFLIHFNLLLGNVTLVMGHKIYLRDFFFLNRLYLFDSNFQR